MVCSAYEVRPIRLSVLIRIRIFRITQACLPFERYPLCLVRTLLNNFATKCICGSQTTIRISKSMAHRHSNSRAPLKHFSPSTSDRVIPTASTSTPAPPRRPARPWKASCGATRRITRRPTYSQSDSPSRCSGEASPSWRQVTTFKVKCNYVQ